MTDDDLKFMRERAAVARHAPVLSREFQMFHASAGPREVLWLLDEIDRLREIEARMQGLDK